METRGTPNTWVDAITVEPMRFLQLISAKKADADAAVSSFEAEIDQLVYSIYGLRRDEIRIVEEATIDIGAGERGAPNNKDVAGVGERD